MSSRLYLTPHLVIVRSWGSGRPAKRPKYVGDLQGQAWAARQYGHQGWSLLAGDFDPAIHSTLASAPDVFVIPENLDQVVGGQVATVEDALETMGYPGDWVQATHTYRRVPRLVWATIRLFRRVAGILNTTVPFLAGQVTLETQFNQLPAAGRAALLQVASEWNLDTSGMTGSTKLREIIKFLADQLPNKSIGGVLI
jgi:hypothetical protein